MVVPRSQLDWIEQGLTSPPAQYRLSGRQFYRSKDPTNSIKILKETFASHSTEEAPNPPGASHRVTSEPLKKKKNPITVDRTWDTVPSLHQANINDEMWLRCGGDRSRTALHIAALVSNDSSKFCCTDSCISIF